MAGPPPIILPALRPRLPLSRNGRSAKRLCRPPPALPYHPEAVIRAALREPDYQARYQALMRLADQLDFRSIPQVLALERLIPNGSLRYSFRGQLLTRWATMDPVAALKQVEALPAGADRNQQIQAVLKGWAQVDLAGANAWVQRLPVGSSAWMR